MEERKYEKPTPKLYFYKLNGKLKPFYYCSLCGKGPFKDIDFDDHKIIMRSGNDNRQKIYHCKSCDSILFHATTITLARPRKQSSKQSKNH